MTHAPHSDVAQHAAEAAHGAAEAVFPPFDPTYFASQLFWLAIFFVILYVALDRFILPKIKTTIEDRRDRIADDLDAAAQAKADADAAGEAYEKALAEARAKAHAIAADTRKALDAEIAKETAEVEAEAARDRGKLSTGPTPPQGEFELTMAQNRTPSVRH